MTCGYCWPPPGQEHRATCCTLSALGREPVSAANELNRSEAPNGSPTVECQCPLGRGFACAIHSDAIRDAADVAQATPGQIAYEAMRSVRGRHLPPWHELDDHAEWDHVADTVLAWERTRIVAMLRALEMKHASGAFALFEAIGEIEKGAARK